MPSLVSVSRVRSRLTLAALVLSLSLAGCSSDEPAAPAPVAPSSSPASSDPAPATPQQSTPSAVPVAPELPAAATTFDAAGAEAFVRHFWDVVNHAYATGDTDPVLAISDSGCGACQSLVDNVESVTDEGSRWVGMGWETSDYLSADPDANGRGLVSGLLSPIEGAYVVDADGSRDEVTLEAPSDFQMITEWDGSRWALIGISSFSDGSAQ